SLKALGKCMRALGAQAGSDVVLWECNEEPLQRWEVQGQTIALSGTKLCLEVPEGLPSYGSHLQVAPCDGGPAQQWRVDGADSGSASF
ncbi:MAG TPA: RICIN domain-containing protein, partial [Myxococcota bacterium]|nr:RICIN domain-containing protein [Myxococcota bacterium]